MKKTIYKMINIKDVPEFLAVRLKDALKQMPEKPAVITTSAWQGERKACRRRSPVPVSEWAERHRYVTRGPFEGQRFKRNTVPYAGPIMDASFHKSVEEIVICAADQVAKSFIVDTCVGYAADRAPGPVLIVYPDENTAGEAMTDRIGPMLTMSPRLNSYKRGSRDDNTVKRINLIHMQIYAAWARSPIALANRSIKYLILDETDKYPPLAGLKEADPVSKAEKRVRTFRYGRKIWKCSTPTIEAGVIWTELNSCQAVFEYHVTCPDCGAEQLMEFEQIKWPEDERDPVRVKFEGLAHYVCPHCGSCWTNTKRDAAVRWGKWIAMHKTPDGKKELKGGPSTSSGQAGLELFEYLKKYNPGKIGFHIPSWISPFISISDAAAAFLKSLRDKTALKDFRNSHAALPWLDYTEERKEDRILLLKDDRPAGIVPGGDVISCLTAGIDTQDNGLWYEIRAWGWPDEDLTLTSWQVRFGYLDGKGFAGIKKILTEDRYKDTEGKEYFVALALQDAMGHRTADVYDFCRLNRRFIIPTQGVDTRRMTSPHTWSNIEFYPGGKKPIPGGLKLIRFDATHYKNKLANKLEINPEDPGAWILCAETTEEWARHMCAEYVDDKTGLWVCPENRANHGWDCSVLNLVAAEIAGVKYMRRQKSEAGSQKSETGDQRKNKRWIPKKDGWMKKR